MVPRPEQNRRSVDALKKCDNDALVVTAVSKVFWRQRTVRKARTLPSMKCGTDQG